MNDTSDGDVVLAHWKLLEARARETSPAIAATSRQLLKIALRADSATPPERRPRRIDPDADYSIETPLARRTLIEEAAA